MPNSVKAIVDAYEAGNATYKVFRKVPTQTTATGIWFDLSMSPGAPVAQYYVGVAGTATRLARSTDLGLDHGPDPTGYTKYLHKLLVMTQTATAVPLPMILCDYLLHYPFLGMDVGETELSNPPAATIPRYTTGAGVRVMAIEIFPQSVGGAQFFITYTNSDGVSGRVSPTVTCNTQVATGTVITSAPTTANSAGPFLPLQAGDSGVRSIESITWLSGDVGVIALVLVKPLLTHSIFDITAPCEVDFVIDRNVCPEIKADAFLGLIALPSGTLAAASIVGELHTFWS